MHDIFIVCLHEDRPTRHSRHSHMHHATVCLAYEFSLILLFTINTCLHRNLQCKIQWKKKSQDKSVYIIPYTCALWSARQNSIIEPHSNINIVMLPLWIFITSTYWNWSFTMVDQTTFTAATAAGTAAVQWVPEAKRERSDIILWAYTRFRAVASDVWQHHIRHQQSVTKHSENPLKLPE